MYGGLEASMAYARDDSMFKLLVTHWFYSCMLMLLKIYSKIVNKMEQKEMKGRTLLYKGIGKIINPQH